MNDYADFLEIQTQTAWGRALKEFAGWCSPPPGARIFDAGCGPGLLPALFWQAGHFAAGLDSDFSLLRGSPFTSCIAQGNIYRLPFTACSFDLLTATNVIFLLGDPLRALRECRRVLKADGQLCLLNPSERLNTHLALELADARGLDGKNRESLLGWACRAEKFGGWTEEKSASLLRCAGFKQIETILRVGPGFARFSRAVLA